MLVSLFVAWSCISNVIIGLVLLSNLYVHMYAAMLLLQTIVLGWDGLQWHNVQISKLFKNLKR
jgi:hypothetical protein